MLGLAITWRDGWLPGNARGTGPRPAACGAARNRILNRGGASSEGGEAHESNGSAVPPWPGPRTGTENGLPGGARLRSGRAGHSHGEPSVARMVGSSRHAHGRVLAADLSVAGNRGPGSCVRGPPPGGPVRAKSWRCGESDVNSWRLCAGGDRRAKPARKHEARESGYGSSGREGSEGRSRDASGMKQGREASGATAHGRVRKDPVRVASITSPNRREGQEP